MSKLRIESTRNRHTKRIVDGDKVIGMAIQYMNDFWAPHDLNNKRLSAPVHKTPTGVRRWFEEHQK